MSIASDWSMSDECNQIQSIESNWIPGRLVRHEKEVRAYLPTSLTSLSMTNPVMASALGYSGRRENSGEQGNRGNTRISICPSLAIRR